MSSFSIKLKTISNIFQHCSINMFAFFRNTFYRVTLVPLGAIGFNGLIVNNEVTGFGELAVCSVATLSGNLAVVGMILP